MGESSSKSFHSFSAELSNPLCSLQEIYLLCIREADRAAQRTDSGVRMSGVESSLHHSTSPVVGASALLCFRGGTGSLTELTAHGPTRLQGHAVEQDLAASWDTMNTW